jgi:hypothetical protein
LKSDNLLKLYFDQLDQIHSAETQIRDALPKMIEAATEPELKARKKNTPTQSSPASPTPPTTKPTKFLAGEATDVSGHNGTVHGAIARGHRAAAEIVRTTAAGKLKSKSGD